MTKKHFQKIADDIKIKYQQATTTKELRTLEELVDDLCATFASVNKLFDKSRFKLACGIR